MADVIAHLESPRADHSKVTDVLEPIDVSAGISTGISSALKENSEYVLAVSKLSEAQNIKDTKLRRKLTSALTKVMKAKPSAQSFADKLKAFVDNPTDELLLKIMPNIISSGSARNINRDLTEADTDPYELVDKIEETQAGTKAPTEENFDSSPQVVYGKFTSTFTVGRKPQDESKRSEGFGGTKESGFEGLKVTGKLTGFVTINYNAELTDREGQIKDEIENEIELFNQDYDEAYVTFEYPPLFKALVGEQKITYIESNYESKGSENYQEDIDANEVLEYFKLAARLKNGKIILPELKDHNTGNALFIKSKSVNPYLKILLTSGADSLLEDTMSSVSNSSYLSEDAIKEVFDEVDETSTYLRNTSKATTSKDTPNKQNLWDTIKKAIVAMKEDSDIPSWVTGLDADTQKALKSQADDITEEQLNSVSTVENLVNIPFDIDEFLTGEVQHAIGQIDNAPETRLPALNNKLMAGLLKDTTERAVFSILSQNPENLEYDGSALDNAYSPVTNVNVAMRILLNFAHVGSDDIDSTVKDLVSTMVNYTKDGIIDADEGDEIADKIEDFIDELSGSLANLLSEITESIRTKLMDIIKRPTYYTSKTEESLMNDLVGIGIIREEQ
tara:strand:+ start:1465 stop:3321 length:1857 start_codon:yes stop_codon:yes gene_type:complete